LIVSVSVVQEFVKMLVVFAVVKMMVIGLLLKIIKMNNNNVIVLKKAPGWVIILIVMEFVEVMPKEMNVMYAEERVLIGPPENVIVMEVK